VNDIHAQMKKQDETISLLRGLLEHMRAERVQANTSQSNFNLNAGGVGVWAAVTACAMTLAACIPVVVILAMLTIDQGRKIERLDDYLSTIFQQAPELRKEIDQKRQEALKKSP
jgi:hypothetical protein